MAVPSCLTPLPARFEPITPPRPAPMPAPRRFPPLKPGLKLPAKGLPPKLLRLLPNPAPANPPNVAPIAVYSSPNPLGAKFDPKAPPRPAPTAPPKSVLLSKPPKSCAFATGAMDKAAIATPKANLFIMWLLLPFFASDFINLPHHRT